MEKLSGKIVSLDVGQRDAVVQVRAPNDQLQTVRIRPRVPNADAMVAAAMVGITSQLDVDLLIDEYQNTTSIRVKTRDAAQLTAGDDGVGDDEAEG